MGLFDTGIIDSLSSAINNLAKKQSNAIVEGFIEGAKIIADKLQEIEDNKNISQLSDKQVKE
jgi:hypothetical protein